MRKQEIKDKIKEAIKNNPFRDEIKKVSLFSSYLNGKPRKDSDIDVLIEFTPSAQVGFFELIAIQNKFEEYLKKPIDLLTPEQLSKYFRDEVIKQAETIYER